MEALTTAAQMPAEPSIPVVAITGVSLVFLVLVLLIFIISIQGKIFDKIEARKAAKAKELLDAALAEAQNSEQVSATAAPVKVPPMVEEGIPEEVVAAIVAAVAAVGGGKYTLRSLTRANTGRGKWGAAGAVSGTEPF